MLRLPMILCPRRRAAVKRLRRIVDAARAGAREPSRKEV
jgi:hypothetical protein